MNDALRRGVPLWGGPLWEVVQMTLAVPRLRDEGAGVFIPQGPSCSDEGCSWGGAGAGG